MVLNQQGENAKIIIENLELNYIATLKMLMNVCLAAGM
jgi:hypothetical protein